MWQQVASVLFVSASLVISTMYSYSTSARSHLSTELIGLSELKIDEPCSARAKWIQIHTNEHITYGTVGASEIQRPTTVWMVLKPSKIMGIFTIFNWWVYRISEPSIVLCACCRHGEIPFAANLVATPSPAAPARWLCRTSNAFFCVRIGRFWHLWIQQKQNILYN